VPKVKHVNAAYASYNIDNTWYTDMGSTDHITSELNKLSMREKYNGTYQIHTASGSGMSISHVGHSVLHTPDRELFLNNVLHVPKAKKNLVFVHHFTTDNNAYLEFHPHVFFVKDQATKKTILKGACKGVLYPLPSSSTIHPERQAWSTTKPSVETWHNRLGHPSSPIVCQVLSKNNLPCSPSESSMSQCVMLANKLRVINYLIQGPLVNLMLP
jgi:hypothetical protein